MTMNSKSWIAAAAVTVAMYATAHAETFNEVRAVSFTDDGTGITRVNVRGDETPTFTVYKLEKPTRVVIDLPHAKLSDVLRGHESANVLQPNTWAVSTIASQQLDDGAVRVIVTMARPGRYDVKTEGKDVVVMVMPRDPMPKTANPEELAAARQQAETAAKQAQAAEVARAEAEHAKTNAERARSEAELARSEADRLRKAAETAQKAVEQASAADLAKAKAAAAKAARDADDAKQAAARAQVQAERQRNAAEQARRDAVAEADKAKTEAAKAKADAMVAKDAAAKAKAEALAAQADAAKLRAEALAAQNDAARAKSDAARAKSEAAAAQNDAARTKAEAELAKANADRTLAEAEKTKADAERARGEVARTKAEADAAKREAEAAKAEALAAKADAQKQIAETKHQLADMEKKTAAAQAMEDKARSVLAMAQAREEAARDAASAAAKEREIAEAAMQRAQHKRDTADATNRAKLIADAKAAEDRLAKARAATADADAQRKLAEQAAATAKQELEHSKSALATVESQRVAAVAAATDAVRKRSEAESAAIEASRKRGEAEAAANDATKRTGKADAQRVAAEEAARAADKQRRIAEAAAADAVTAKHQAEASLADLTKKRAAAEHAADEVTIRAKAQAKAEADMAAATSRQAGDAELAAARREVAKLTEERKRAEAELADRRKAVAQQQSEAARLEAVAASARDAASREESRRTQLAQQREDEERELAKLKAAKVQAQVAAAPARVEIAKVKNVTFKGNEQTGVVELAMAGEGNVSLGDITQTHVELIVDNAQLAQRLERTLDVSKFGSPVRKISSYNDRRSPNRVRLVAELSAPAIPTVTHDGGVVRWRFASNDVAQTATKPHVVGGFGAASTPLTQQSVSQLPGNAASNRGRRIYHGATVDFDFKDAPIHDLLRILADTGGVNIVVPDTVDAKVTVRLKRVPWDQALEVILASHDLWYRREGNLYRIAPRKELDAEDEAEAARRSAAVQAEAPKPTIVTLDYASADELRPKFEGMLSPKGKIEVDGRTNSLIINDIAYNRNSIEALARELDTQTPQITIEARIVEAQSTFVRQFGIQWGGRALSGPGGGNSTGLIFPSSIGIRGANTDAQTPEQGVSSLPSDFAINLPAATGTGEGGAIGMSLGSIGGNFNINLRLSALEDTGTVRIVSAPKITVLNNKPANIKSGVSIPISVVSAAGTQTQFVQADLKLEVTPYVSQRDCSIAMNINVTKNEPDFVNTGARGDPTILRREAQTTMLVADGETSVLGGIYTRNSGLSYKKVPFFGDLPVIGWFFKNRRENDTRTEILVFITPKITNRASLHCVQ
jgi:type IV pilus assembly protein PilQ